MFELSRFCPQPVRKKTIITQTGKTLKQRKIIHKFVHFLRIYCYIVWYVIVFK